ncbi:MAG: hypothetical protein HOE88_01235 [Flavobacteriales bacterium]|jgi:hypothetical protein|nr:hypothetical protein [Flavobacteriales bacterium]NCF95830.1 hypothetical protein [Bacteroidota bacterium]MBT3573083.1 hypothetical protein [Flavobacteriales bacterium]MBT3740551.1 hypothetical protein [Flavobacteriales bacterium]MBT4101996.1 hypothetical protein [Flavobacteriales bacterium]
MKDMEKRIIKTLCTKASNKQLVHRQALASFELLKTVLKLVAKSLNDQVCRVDKHVVVEYVERSEHEVGITFSGDTLIFLFHSNAFKLPDDHFLLATPYVREDGNRKYYGLIHAYNFLSDSMKMRRMNDLGTLLSRLLINGEGHHFAEGGTGLSMPLTENGLDEAILKSWVERLMIHAMDMDLVIADFTDFREITVMELEGLRNELRLQTSKRLGFRPS